MSCPKPGQGILGPEFPGCLNSGSRPLLLRNPHLAQSGDYNLVGTVTQVERLQLEVALQRIRGHQTNIVRD